MKVEKRLGVEAGGKEEKENTTRVSLVWRSVVVCSSETHFGGFGSIAVQLPERVVSSPVSCFLNSALEFKWGPGKYPLGGKIPRSLESEEKKKDTATSPASSAFSSPTVHVHATVGIFMNDWWHFLSILPVIAWSAWSRTFAAPRTATREKRL
jgi:hypothetical protein